MRNLEFRPLGPDDPQKHYRTRNAAVQNLSRDWARNRARNSARSSATNRARNGRSRQAILHPECVPGQAALEGPEWASRMVMFRLYYLGLTPYERARHFLGLSEINWVNWSDEIRRRCGKEMLNRRMFPPRKYFSAVGD